MQPFIYQNWHAWQATQGVLLSDENTKTLHAFAGPDDAINWLFLKGHRDAARSLNAHKKKGKAS